MIKNKLQCLTEQRDTGGLLESDNFINFSSFSLGRGEVFLKIVIWTLEKHT